MTKLTKASIASLPRPTSRVDISDDDMKGLVLRLSPSGAMTWVAAYRLPGSGRSGTPKRVTLGRYPALGIEDARKAAKRVLAQVALGDDPAAARRSVKEQLNVAQAVAYFMQQHVEAKRKGGTAREYGRAFDQHLIPRFGTKKLKDLKRADVAALHTAMSKDGPVSANRMLIAVSSLWNWCARREWCDPGANPARFIEKNREQAKNRYLSDEELARLGAALRQAETIGLPWRMQAGGVISKHTAKPENRRTQFDPMVAAALRLLLLSGMRISEVLGLEWSHVDFQRGLLHLPDSKTGAKLVVLSAPALQVLDGLPQIEGSAFVFPARGGGKRPDLKKPWDALCAAAGLEGVRIHDLRHTNAATGAGAGLSLHLIGGLLGHKQAVTTQRYAHLANDPLRRATEKIGARINEALGDAGRGGEVIPLVRR